MLKILKIEYLGDLWFASGSTRRCEWPCSILLYESELCVCIKFLN